MTDVVIVQPIADSGAALLRSAGLSVFVAPSPDIGTMLPHLEGARAVITRNAGFPAEGIAAAPSLRVIAVHGTGTDKVDKLAAAARGIPVLNTPGANANSVAEVALTLMLACAKDLTAAEHAARSADTGYRDRRTSFELGGRSIGLVGFGHVARRLASLTRSMGMSVWVLSQHTSANEIDALGLNVAPDLDALCDIADVISLHGIPGPQPLFDASRLQRLRAGTILINTARGGLVDEAALAASLRNGHLGAAGLDVTQQEPLSFDSPLLACPRLILTPHIGGASREAMERTGQEVARKVLSALGLTA